MSAHLLLVEDDDAIADALRLHLEQAGYRLHREADGLRAMAAIDRQRWDLVLLDLMLPGADGWDVCRHLRGRHADVPVIMLSARSAEAHRVLGLELGADDYLTKPFSMAELLARVKALLRRAELLRAAQTAPAQQPAVRNGELEILPGRRTGHVGTGAGLLRLDTVQPVGRKPMPGADWARGAHLPPTEWFR